MLYEASEICRGVEQLLQTNGVYRPVDWLLESGRLAAPDLARWSGGDTALRLADCLYGDPRAIGEELQCAVDHARSLGLSPETEVLAGRPGHPPGLADGWLETVWRKPPAPQMDLFFDGRSASRPHVLLRALRAADVGAAESALDDLERHEPGHPLVAAAVSLIAALRGLPEDDQTAWSEMERVSELAEARLGEDAADFLRPLWSRLAERLSRRPGSGIHPSAAWLRVPDWPKVAASLDRDPGGVRGPELLIRGLRAWHRLGEKSRAMLWLFHLCWRYPEMGVDIEQLADRELGLESALDEWDRQELATHWGWQDFPSWLKIHRYVSASLGREDPSAPESFPALNRVLNAPEDIAAREALQAVAPGLLADFLQAHSRRGGSGT